MNTWPKWYPPYRIQHSIIITNKNLFVYLYIHKGTSFSTNNGKSAARLAWVQQDHLGWMLFGMTTTNQAVLLFRSVDG